MSIEGMWATYFGDVATPGHTGNSGVIVLETGRVFGGDSLIAYLGSYNVSGGQVEAKARTWSYNPHIEVITAFGRPGPIDTEVVLQASFDAAAGRIEGTIYDVANPNIKLPVVMNRISDLP